MSAVTTAGVAMGMMGSMLMNGLMGDQGGASATQTPPVSTPTPMAIDPKTKQKKTEQELALSSAGQLTPQATLLSGNEKRSVLGG